MIALVAVAIRRRRAHVATLVALAGLLVAQVLVGALNVWLDEYEAPDLLPPAPLGHARSGRTPRCALTLALAPGRHRALAADARRRWPPDGGGVRSHAPARRRTATVVSDYVELTKPKVQSLLLFTTVTTMYVAGDPSARARAR